MILRASWRRSIYDRPEHAQLFDGAEKLVKIHRFYDVGIHPEPVACQRIFFFFGRRQYDHGNHLEPLVRSDLLQDLQSIQLRQFQIQQNDGRALFGARRELFSAIQIVQGLLTVADNDDLVRELVFVKGGKSKLNIPWIVLND